MDILLFKHPGIKLAINVETGEVIDNPDNFKIPSDKVLTAYAKEYDDHKAIQKEKEDVVKTRLLNAISTDDEERAIAENLLKALMG